MFDVLADRPFGLADELGLLLLVQPKSFGPPASHRTGWNRLRFGRSGIVGGRSYIHLVRWLNGFLLFAGELCGAFGEGADDA